jgi:hypothetical protein
MKTENKKIYPKGINAFLPSGKAPDWILANILIEPNELYRWLKENPSLIKEVTYKGKKHKQIKLILAKGKDRLNLYVDTYQAKTNDSKIESDDNVPF